MARSEILAIAVIAILMTVSFQQAFALKCWTCSSDSVRPTQTQSQFCKDPFAADKISEKEKEMSYKECEERPNQNVYCRKLIQNVKNETVIFRSCFYKPLNAPKDQCFDNVTVSFIKNEHCDYCDRDGCNGAAQYGPIALFIVVPVAIAHLLFL